MEALVQLDDERVRVFRRHPLEDGLLSKGMLQLLVRQHMSFRDRLERVQARATLVSDDKDLASTSFAQHSNHLKVVYGDFFGFAWLLLADCTLFLATTGYDGVGGGEGGLVACFFDLGGHAGVLAECGGRGVVA